MPVSSTPSKRVALAPVNINTVASPLSGFKNRRSHNSGTALDSLPLTPTLTPKFGLAKLFSSLVLTSSNGALMPAAKARKMESFSEYKITNSRNVKADLAATKLKLRLQLALYKLRQKKKAAVATSPNIRVSKTRPNLPQLLLPLLLRYLRQKSFTSSANVNLQKPKLTTKAPRLNMVASSKKLSEDTCGASKGVNASQMKLYHIKALSSFYNTYSHRLPLTSASTQRLPPVHKILRTPIKAASRAMLQLGNGSVTASNNPNSNSDETIDESVDDNAGDYLRRKLDNILSSSPLRQSSFGTPNSFSVAKSLLQLGLGYY